jgi:hypothetical protein
MPPGEQATPKKRSARYVVEIRDAKGSQLVFTAAEWTADERDNAIGQILRLAGLPKPAVDESPKGRAKLAKKERGR